MKMQQIIWSLQIIMMSSFIIFSFIPLLRLIIPLFSYYLIIFFISIFLLSILGFIALFGIITLKLDFRNIVTLFFSCGILFYIENPYLLALAVIITWMFHEMWFISFKYHQLDKEYSTYPPDSIEKQKLLKTFQMHLNSFILLAWIVLSISWGILLIANNFYIELGTGEYGTLGIAISVAIILLIYLVQKYVRSSTKNFV